jgi:protein-S-isoprenylcysteine O-methyltransferase Ste14
MRDSAYLLQAALICSWWFGLAISESLLGAFQFEGISEIAFWSFMAPDLLMIATLSVIRAYRRSNALEYTILGAFAYATLYCLHASFLTRSGLLPTGLMLLGLAYNLFLLWGHRVFRNSSTGLLGNILKTLVQVICIWLLTLVLVPGFLLVTFPVDPVRASHPLTVLGGGLFIIASALGLVASYFMVRFGQGTPLPLDQTNELVTTGPYQYVRNPMAIAGIGQGLSLALLFHSLPVAIYAILGALVWHWAVRPVEEGNLAARFGEPYLLYRKRVSCWIPGGPRRPRDPQS